MAFEAVLTFPNYHPLINRELSIKGRAYIHNCGLCEVYSDIYEAANYFARIVDDKHFPIRFDYLIATIWAKSSTKEQIVDCFGYHVDQWPGNPDVTAWSINNGIYTHADRALKELTCGDTLIVLGEEEQYRRTTKSLEDYLSTRPKISGFIGFEPLEELKL